MVAKEIKRDTWEDLFAAMPPLEAKKVLFSRWACVPGVRLDFRDVDRTYCCTRAMRRVCVELPNQDFEEGKRVLLKKSTHGTRDAAQNWELEQTEMTAEAGFRQGSLSACVFCHEQNVGVVVRGDDLTVLGPSESLDWLRGVAQQKWR